MRVVQFPQRGTVCAQRGGGQDLLHLANRSVAFKLQFIEQFLTGLSDLIWKDMASYMLYLKLNGLPFFQSIFKCNSRKGSDSFLGAKGAISSWAQTGHFQ